MSSDAFLGSRLEYARHGLREKDLSPNPLDQLSRWLEEAVTENVLEPTAVCLSTVSASGRPSSRMVLLRELSPKGLSFFTNYTSQKGRELEANPNAAMCFWWGILERQVRVEGVVEKLAPEESDRYFESRPFASRLASASSPQSQVIQSREELDHFQSHLLAEFGQNLTRPPHWGGYRLVPDRFEFWQGRPARLHDRFEFRLIEGIWKIARLAP
ncbi:MAG: pyridoxamine 5'-phosphate oxidase [Armatimonadetes bacterium]|nr:pyridoxamine 5'-phosphate oxidase [Armatimonadota bacterium]